MLRFIFIFLFGVLIRDPLSAQAVSYTVTPGKGFDGFVIGETTFEDIITRLGTHYKTDTFYVTPIGTALSDTLTHTTKIYSYSLIYDSLGISFFKRHKQKTIFTIHFQSPASVVTDQGIRLNVSTFSDVIDTYGPTAWSFTYSNTFKEYKGIRFERATTRPYGYWNDSDLYLSKPVTGISIIKKTKR